MKKFSSILLLPVLFLSACGGGGGEAAKCAQEFWNGELGLCLPANWKILDQESLAARGVLEEVIVAFQGEDTVVGQFPTVIVTREPLPQPVNTETYSRASIRSVAALPGYQVIDTRSVKRLDGEAADLHIFRAQPMSDEPERRFYQISAVSAGNGYTVTGLLPLSVEKDLEEQILLMLRSLTFQEKQSGGAEE